MTILVEPIALTVCGFACSLDERLGLLSVAHDGRITWDELQAVKDAVWGVQTRAIEVYPRRADVVNSGNWRHLWRLGPGDWCPDLLEHRPASPGGFDRLEARHHAAWATAEEVFR